MGRQQKLSESQIKANIADMVMRVRGERTLQVTAHMHCKYSIRDKTRARSVLDKLLQQAAIDTELATVSSIEPYIDVNYED